MSNSDSTIWKREETRQFSQALLSVSSQKTMQDFLRDVMTEKEIIEISSRLEAARMLRQGNTYSDIVAKTKLSSRTVARISEWMKNGRGGYATVLDQIDANHGHISPVRAV